MPNSSYECQTSTRVIRLIMSIQVPELELSDCIDRMAGTYIDITGSDAPDDSFSETPMRPSPAITSVGGGGALAATCWRCIRRLKPDVWLVCCIVAKSMVKVA